MNINNKQDAMEFVPLLPNIVKDGDAGQLPIQANEGTLKLPVEDQSDILTSTTPNTAVVEPVQQPMYLPSIRLEDYYAVKVPPPRSVSSEHDTTESESSDGHGTPPPPSIRLEDVDAILAAQREDAMEVDATAPDEADVVNAHIEADPMPTRPERKKHKAMSAVQQKQTMEALRAKLMLFSQAQVQPQQPKLLPTESQLQSPPPPSPPATSSPTTVITQRGSTPEHETSTNRGAGRSGPRSNKAIRAAAKRKKCIENLSDEVKDIIQRLRNLGEPLYKEIEEMTSSASAILDKREDADELAEQLLKLEKDWKAVHDEKRREVIAFFERYGFIPMGSMA